MPKSGFFLPVKALVALVALVALTRISMFCLENAKTKQKRQHNTHLVVNKDFSEVESDLVLGGNVVVL